MRVLVVAPWVPPMRPGHAGGAAVRRHLVQLAETCEVALLTPVDAASSPPSDLPGVQIVPVRFRASTDVRGKLSSYARWLVKGFGWPPGAAKEAMRALGSEGFPETLGRVDLVESQYLESLPVAHSVASQLHVPLVVWVHDIVSVELRRQLGRSLSLRLRIEAAVRLPRTRVLERRLLPACAGAIVFNPNDVATIRDLGCRGPVAVVRPAIVEGNGSLVEREDPIVLAVAAFSRPANREGLDWFLSKVWPTVRASAPAAELRLVGSDAPSVDTPGVTTVGFIDDLSVEYQRARVAIAPLFTGAGLKFKVPQAFSWRLPVVATPVAAEGLTPPSGSGFAAVTTDPDRFADAVSRMLSDPEEARAIGERGAEWWSQTVQGWIGEEDIVALYERLATVRQ